MPLPQADILAKFGTQPNPNRVLIVGSGIVGAALANFLSVHSSLEVVLIDRSLNPLTGSTGHAPGFVGHLNQDPHLTRLAKASVNAYHGILGGFDRVGGLEIATSPTETEGLQERLRLATEAGLRARRITADEAVPLAPDFVQLNVAKAALHFPDDGIANADTITTVYRAKAAANGATILKATAERLIVDLNRAIQGLETDLGPILARHVIFATGIWTDSLLKPITTLPIFPVAHPYLRGGSPLQCRSSPFVRYPSAKIYIRNHDQVVGIGSYDHPPLPVDSPGYSALEPWPNTSNFDDSLHKARSFFPDPSVLDGGHRINGVFALTPDNLPLAGPVKTWPGLWVAAAVWVTHAAGTAKMVADMLVREVEGTAAARADEGGDGDGDGDAALERALDPERFAGQDPKELRTRALNWYSDIGKYLA